MQRFIRNMGQNFTTISEIGEFELIKRITTEFPKNQTSTIAGIGDDAAVIATENLQQTVVTSDMLVEGVHFDIVYTPLKHLGYKAVVVNLSDLAAMNAKPTQILINIAISSRYTVESIEELYDGVRIACEEYKVDLIGGDTTSSKSGLVISVTAIGVAKSEEIIYRNGASKNQLVCVTGDLGGAFLGLTLLEREKRVFLEDGNMQPALEGFEYPLQRQLRPTARTDMRLIFETLNLIPTSMIDISDGLSSDINHLCIQSNVGCMIFENKLPFDPSVIELAAKFNLNSSLCALNGGEDYELLFTIQQSDFEKVKNHPDISVIGFITEASEGMKMELADGNIIDLSMKGWNSFSEA